MVEEWYVRELEKSIWLFLVQPKGTTVQIKRFMEGKGRCMFLFFVTSTNKLSQEFLTYPESDSVGVEQCQHKYS